MFSFSENKLLKTSIHFFRLSQSFEVKQSPLWIKESNTIKDYFQRHWHQLSLILIILWKTGFVLFVIAEGENACSENNLCINGATCVVDGTTYSCLCSNGFTGTKCESKLLNVFYASVKENSASVNMGKSRNCFEWTIYLYLSSVYHEPSILTMRRDWQKKKKNNKENFHLTTKTTTQCRIKTVWWGISM